MGVIRCDSCGGSVIINEDKKTATCEYCRSVILLPGVSTAGNKNQSFAGLGTQDLMDEITTHLRNKEWKTAKYLCNQVIHTQPDNSQIYQYLMMIDFHCEKEEDLVQQVSDIDHNANYQKALLYADEQFKNQLISYKQQIIDRINQEIYEKAIFLSEDRFAEGTLKQAYELFDQLGDYKDAISYKHQIIDQVNQEKYEKAISLSENRKAEGNLLQAYELFDQLGDYKDADLKKRECAVDIVKINKEGRPGTPIIIALLLILMIHFRFIPGVVVLLLLFLFSRYVVSETIKKYQDLT